jgi:transcriptional regulator with XRE-family HTH domain
LDLGTCRIDQAVRAARERRGWTREALAFHSGLSWSAIAQIESGRRTSLRPASLTALATALGVSVDYLLGRVPSPDATPLLQHRVLVYTTEEEFLAGVRPCFAEGMARGDPLLAVTTPSRGRALRREFGKDSDLRLADASRWYRSLTSALNSYLAFIDEKIAAGASLVRIVGEPGWSDHSSAEIDSWNRYEALINVALAATPAEIICAYNAVTAPERVLACVGETHPETVDTTGLAAKTPHYDPYDVLLRPARDPF